MSAKIVPPTSENLQTACSILAAGGLVAMPTETVYGLCADAANPVAIARIYDVKGRPDFNPLIAHIAGLEMAERQGHFSADAKALAGAVWPGPLSMVVNIRDTTSIASIARAGLDSVALRDPAHPVARSLISTFGAPLVAPSANLSGRISPTRAQHVFDDLGDRIDLIIDGGACQSGLESTIIDARDAHPALLRLGPVAAPEIDALWPGLKQADLSAEKPVSPGQLLRHYAPDARLRINATTALPDEGYLGFGPVESDLNLSPASDLVEAAANLFDMLRQLDAQYTQIAVAPIPSGGVGDTINERLARAAERA